MNKIKSIFGIAPYHEGNQIFTPSKVALKLAVDKKTDYNYAEGRYKKVKDHLKVLVIGTEMDLLKMQNGTFFRTGNHPYELFVPLLHFVEAGFDIDFATPTGLPMKLEEWAMPEDDEAVMSIAKRLKPKMDAPLDLRSVALSLDKHSEYIGVYIPGGHGAINDLPFSEAVGKVIHWCAQHNRTMITICHGPAALLAFEHTYPSAEFPYKGYNLSAFPDFMDKLLPTTGYIPGPMPWYFGEKLKNIGLNIVNKIATGKVIQDRKLITGDSLKASNELGRIATEQLLLDAQSWKKQS